MHTIYCVAAPPYAGAHPIFCSVAELKPSDANLRLRSLSLSRHANTLTLTLSQSKHANTPVVSVFISTLSKHGGAARIGSFGLYFAEE